MNVVSASASGAELARVVGIVNNDNSAHFFVELVSRGSSTPLRLMTEDHPRGTAFKNFELSTVHFVGDDDLLAVLRGTAHAFTRDSTWRPVDLLMSKAPVTASLSCRNGVLLADTAGTLWRISPS
jgi:hypothetical protein